MKYWKLPYSNKLISSRRTAVGLAATVLLASALATKVEYVFPGIADDHGTVTMENPDLLVDLVVPPDIGVDLAGYIAERWVVDFDSAKRIVSIAHDAAQSHDLDPLLVLAVVARESSFKFNGNAGTLKTDVSSSSIDPAWAHGLMQVAGRFHPEKMPVDARGNMRVTTDEENLHIGSRILREYLDKSRGNITRALQRYNGNLVPGDTRFAQYVLSVRDQLAEVVREG